MKESDAPKAMTDKTETRASDLFLIILLLEDCFVGKNQSERESEDEVGCLSHHHAF